MAKLVLLGEQAAFLSPVNADGPDASTASTHCTGASLSRLLSAAASFFAKAFLRLHNHVINVPYLMPAQFAKDFAVIPPRSNSASKAARLSFEYMIRPNRSFFNIVPSRMLVVIAHQISLPSSLL
jgi:hypothetical protein